MARPLAVITGASSGIGMVFAQRVAATHDLVLIARRRDRLESLAAELSAKHASRVEILVADLTVEADLAAATSRIAEATNLELLINNAGYDIGGVFWEQPLQGQQNMHRLHVNATVALTHAALANMVPKNRGAVINVCSVSAFVRRPRAVSYGATKSWMAFFTEGLLLDLKSVGSKVTVQALCPGFTYSEFHDVMQVDRGKLAGPALWLKTEDVVDESLAALKTGKLYVVPGWRYKVLVAVLTVLPSWLRLAVESGI